MFSRRNCSSLNRLFSSYFSLSYISLLQPAQYPGTVKILLAYTLISLVFLASYFLSSRLLHLKDETSVSLAMGAAFGNTAFLGYPFILALLGEKGLPPAIFFDQMGNFLSTYTVGVLLCIYIQTKRLSARSLLEIIKLPPFLAFLLAIITNGLSIPPFLWEAINHLYATVPDYGSYRNVLSASSSGIGSLFFSFLYQISFSSLLFLAKLKLSPAPFTKSVIQAATPTLMTIYVTSIYELDSESLPALSLSPLFIAFHCPCGVFFTVSKYAKVNGNMSLSATTHCYLPFSAKR